MRILAFDTAGDSCSIAVADGEVILAQHHENMTRGQDARLLPLIEKLLAESGIAYAALEGIALSTGPGSFTGLRVGLAAAHGLALVTHLPLIGFDCFTLAENALSGMPEFPLLVILESKRAELYARFKNEPAFMATPDALAAMISSRNAAVTGNGALKLPAELHDRILPPAFENHSVVMARLAAAQPLPLPGNFPQPFYLRPPDVSRPKSSMTQDG